MDESGPELVFMVLNGSSIRRLLADMLMMIMIIIYIEYLQKIQILYINHHYNIL